MKKELGISRKARAGLRVKELAIRLPPAGAVIKTKRVKQIITTNIIANHSAFAHAGMNLSRKLKSETKGKL